jgi:photosystem II stability/assembly factor-like uncharacterized protein
MKKLAILTFLLSIPCGALHAAWEVQRQPSPHQIHFQGIDFVDSLHGWVVGCRYHLRPVFYGINTDGRWSYQGGVIGKTSDGGMTWSFTDIDSSICFYDVEFLDTLNGWMVGNCSHGNNWYGLILKTMDGGSTWERDSFPVRADEAFTTLDFVDTLNGWVSGDTMLLHTSDGGNSWEHQIGIGRDLSFVSSTEGWKIVPGSVFRHTTDAGTTWITHINPTSMGLRRLHFVNPNAGFAVGNWDTLLFFADEKSGSAPVWYYRPMNTNNGPFNDVFFVDTLTGYACGEPGIVVKTTDGGITWQKMWVGTNARLWSVDAVGDEVWVCGEWTTLVHNEGSGWEFQLPWSNWLRGVEFLDSLEGWIVGEGAMILHTIDGGDTWESKQLPVSDEFRDVGIRDSVTIFAAGREEKTDNSLMFRTTDAGLSWEEVPIGGKYIRRIDFVDSLYGWTVSLRAYLWWIEVYRTSNGGSTWYKVAEFDTYATEVHDIDFVTRTQGWLPVTRGAGGFFIWGDIFRSTDGGWNWQLQFITNGGRTAYGISMWDTLTGYFCGLDNVHYTHDGGNNWNGQNPAGLWMGIDCGDSNTVWAVGDSGRILRSDDGGLNWNYEESNVEASLERVDFLDTLNGWAVGEAGVILHYGAGVGIVEEEKRILNAKIKLLSPYPNPFQSEVGIPYVIEEEGCKTEDLSLQIYDVSGRKVRDFILDPSRFILCSAVMWDGRDNTGKEASMGLYFAVLRTPKRILSSKKLIKIGGTE